MSMFARNPSFAAHTALTEAELARLAPSLFATEAHHSRSDRFTPVPTIEIVRGLQREGFEVFSAQQANTRDASKRDFTKHMIRLRNTSMRKFDNGDTFEIVLVKGNDGSSAYRMMSGFYRMVCANGLIVGTSLNEVRVRHSGDVMGDVIEGAYTVLGDAPLVMDRVDAMRAISVSRDEALAFATAAHQLRFPKAALPADDAAFSPAPVYASCLLSARRTADVAESENLWGVFNVVQENTVRGGQKGWVDRKDAQGRVQTRRASVRGVEGIDGNRDLNRALWTLAEEMANIKTAA
jgi:hypothetical protein